MSQSSPGHSSTPLNTPQASSQALLDELRVAADRARDERLKLARLFKHTNDLPVNGSAPVNTSVPMIADHRIAELSDQVERLEQAVADKLAALDKSQQDIDSRTQYLESLRHTITDTTSAFVTQVEKAQHFKAHVDAAKQHVKMSAGRVVEDVRQHLAEYEAPIAERLKQLTDLDDQIDKRIARLQQMHKQAGEAVDKHLLSALRAAKEQAADLAAPVKAELDQHLKAQSEKIEKAIQAKIAALDVDVETALNPLTTRFDEIVQSAQAKAEALSQSLPAKLEAQVEKQMDALRETVAKQAEEVVTGLDEKTLEQAEQVMRDRVAVSLDNYLTEAEEEAGGYVDGLIAKLDAARVKALEQFAASAKEVAADRSLDEEQVLHKLDQEVQRLHQQAQERVASAQNVLEQAVDGIHSRASAEVDAAIQTSSKALEQYESGMVEQLRAIDDDLEEGIEESRKRVTDYEKTARKLGDEAMRMVDANLAAATDRLSSFEAGITQRIGLATQSADDAIGSVDGRLDELEQDAAARVSRIVDLAESSGKVVAESIDALSQSAEQTAAKAQRDLEDKLRAFEDISAEALKQAETTLRTNIGELRDASRAMIEVVSKQVRAQASHIEPQTREVIDQAEQTLRRRIGELREGAQSMVDLAVSRLEGQLDEVKRKAQHAAFNGVKGQQDQQSPATDAA